MEIKLLCCLFFWGYLNLFIALFDAKCNFPWIFQSEKRKQDLLAELAVEEQQYREFSKIVTDLLPDPPKPGAAQEKTSRARRVGFPLMHLAV